MFQQVFFEETVEHYQSAISYVASVELRVPIIDLLNDSVRVIGKTDFEVNNEDGSTYSEPLRVNFTLEKLSDRTTNNSSC